MPLRCLLVDDNEAFLEAASLLLEREGVTVVGVASTIAEALRQARVLRPDVILVDIGLGNESGLTWPGSWQGTVMGTWGPRGLRGSVPT